MVRYNLYVDEKVIKVLKLLSKRLQSSTAQLVRNALMEYINKHTKN